MMATCFKKPEVSAQPPAKKTASLIEKETLQFRTRAAGCRLSSSFGSFSSSIRLAKGFTSYSFRLRERARRRERFKHLAYGESGGGAAPLRFCHILMFHIRCQRSARGKCQIYIAAAPLEKQWDAGKKRSHLGWRKYTKSAFTKSSRIQITNYNLQLTTHNRPHTSAIQQFQSSNIAIAFASTSSGLISFKHKLFPSQGDLRWL